MPNVMELAAVAEGPRRVFVYGTLRKGEVNDINRLSPSPVYLGSARVAGTLYPLGWYPGLVLGGEGTVVGEVYAVTPELERRLDEIECLLPEPTGEYLKRELQVDVEGRAMECFVYEIEAGLVANLDPMPEGDWLSRAGA